MRQFNPLLAAVRSACHKALQIEDEGQRIRNGMFVVNDQHLGFIYARHNILQYIRSESLKCDGEIAIRAN
jgi:hypothetical protein